MNILITGGCGFVGHNLVQYLAGDHHHITVVDNLSSGGTTPKFIPKVNYCLMDTKDLNWGILEDQKFDLIFHLGEFSRIVPSFTQIETVWESNVLGTFNILELARLHGAKLVYAGSSTKHAEDGANQSPYAFTKAQNTQLIKNYGQWYGLKYTVCYFYNVFGPGYDSSPVPGYESVVSVFEKQWRAGQPLTICGNGQQTRAFTYVQDIVHGLWLASQYPENEEFQLNNQHQYSILEIANMFSPNIKFLPPRPGDRPQSSAPDNKARELLGWDTTMDVREWIDNVKAAHV